jgi:hypothetical protein
MGFFFSLLFAFCLLFVNGNCCCLPNLILSTFVISVHDASERPTTPCCAGSGGWVLKRYNVDLNPDAAVQSSIKFLLPFKLTCDAELEL